MKIIKRLVEKILTDPESTRILLHDAQVFEEEEAYEDACYYYACAVQQGEKDTKYIDKIIFLFNTYGPFTFQAQLEKMKKEYCSCCDSCGEGYHVGIVESIEEIIKKANKRMHSNADQR